MTLIAEPAAPESLFHPAVAAWFARRFPAGPTGLMNRFFEGYLLPSFTGGVVTAFVSPAAEKMRW